MIPFLIQWPRDATRMVPVPAATAVTLQADCAFTATLGSKTVCSAEACSAVLQLAEVATPTQQTLHWHLPSGELLGCVELLLLPDAESTLIPTQARPPVGESHGVLANLSGAAVQARAAWGSVQSKYDAFLAANLDKAGPGDRRVVIPWVELHLQLGTESRVLGAEHVQSFTALQHCLLWRFSVKGLQLTARLTLGEGNAIRLQLQCLSTAPADLCIKVVPCVEDRSFHHITQAFAGAEQDFPSRVKAEAQGFAFSLQDGHLMRVEGTANFTPSPQWRYCVPLPFCAARGLEPHTDVFSAGGFDWWPAAGSSFHLTAAVDEDAAPQPLGSDAMEAKALPLPAHLQQALRLYLARRSGELTVIAGFPWFLDWGRDSLIFAHGLISAGMLKEAASILRRFATYEQDGTLPNLLRGSEVTNRETSDAPLWLIVVMGSLADAGGDLSGDCGGRSLLQVAQDIVLAKQRLCMDADSGLQHSAAHHTWMDTDNPACTPREGYPIEIQALWCKALRVVAQLAQQPDAAALAERVVQSVESLFWLDDEGHYADCLHGPAGLPAALAVRDDHLRPNQWLAATLGILTQPARLQRMLCTTQCLLVPGAARSLARQQVNQPPHSRPYQGRYTGDEDSCRKPAYHNGTAWCWLYPLYAEAVLRCTGAAGVPLARRLLSASACLLAEACIGQLPEIVDGDLPHAPRGCGAQAWSVSEWLRVWQQCKERPSAGS